MTWLKPLADAIVGRFRTWPLQLLRYFGIHFTSLNRTAAQLPAQARMPHLYNRNAFRIAANPLLDLYSALVWLELSLKDRMAVWARGHDVAEFVSNAGEPALAQRLRTALGSLWCTDLQGNEAHVAPQRYPDLRYLRHQTDFAGKTTDAELRVALTIVRDIETVLTTKGRL
jgi:hypothetical protein